MPKAPAADKSLFNRLLRAMATGKPPSENPKAKGRGEKKKRTVKSKHARKRPHGHD